MVWEQGGREGTGDSAPSHREGTKFLFAWPCSCESPGPWLDSLQQLIHCRPYVADPSMIACWPQVGAEGSVVAPLEGLLQGVGVQLVEWDRLVKTQHGPSRVLQWAGRE